MILASSMLSNCWEFAARHPGILLVLLGVAGEVIFDWKEMKGRLAWAKRFSAIVLIAGLVLEFAEAAKSDRDVSAAIERAGNAEKEAGQANERAAIIESNNAALLMQIEQLKTRRITQLQFDKFINLLKDRPKHPVKVVVEKGHYEAETFAAEIRKMLDAAGYGTNDGSGIMTYDTLGHPDYIGDKTRDAPINFVFYDETPTNVIVWPHFKLIPEGGSSTYAYDSKDTSGAGFIMDAFRAIEITPSTETTSQFLKPGEWVIQVPKRF
jgi:hypothetical protein